MLIKHTINSSDTLRDLAITYLGSADRWIEISAANGIQGADLSALVGTQIVIPVTRAVGLIESDPYFTDLAIVDGDLALVSDDLKTVTGPANYITSLLRAFDTEPKELTEHPDWGFDLEKYAGEAGSTIHAMLMQQEAERVFRGDPRTKDVREVEAVFLGSRKLYQIKAVVIDMLGRMTRFNNNQEV
jgi:hypothetical protein